MRGNKLYVYAAICRATVGKGNLGGEQLCGMKSTNAKEPHCATNFRLIHPRIAIAPCVSHTAQRSRMCTRATFRSRLVVANQVGAVCIRWSKPGVWSIFDVLKRRKGRPLCLVRRENPTSYERCGPRWFGPSEPMKATVLSTICVNMCPHLNVISARRSTSCKHLTHELSETASCSCTATIPRPLATTAAFNAK